jgi:hypothetical protein
MRPIVRAGFGSAFQSTGASKGSQKRITSVQTTLGLVGAQMQEAALADAKSRIIDSVFGLWWLLYRYELPRDEEVVVTRHLT